MLVTYNDLLPIVTSTTKEANGLVSILIVKKASTSKSTLRTKLVPLAILYDNVYIIDFLAVYVLNVPASNLIL